MTPNESSDMERARLRWRSWLRSPEGRRQLRQLQLSHVDFIAAFLCGASIMLLAILALCVL